MPPKIVLGLNSQLETAAGIEWKFQKFYVSVSLYFI